MQDNAKIHTAKKTMNWLKDMGIDLIEWPPYSPDLNPIEQLWFELKNRVNAIDPGLLETTAQDEATMDRFASAIKRAWASIPAARIEGLVRSMDERINAVIAAEGWYTRF